MSPPSSSSAAPRYRCKYKSCQTTCARRADIKRHEVQRHQSSKVFCEQPDCKFRGTTRPAVIRRHFEYRHPELSSKDIEHFLVDKFGGGGDKKTDPKVVDNDPPAQVKTEHWRRPSQDSTTSESLLSVDSYDSLGYTTPNYSQMINTPSSTRTSESLQSHQLLDAASLSYQKVLGLESTPCNIRQPSFTNYIVNSAVCFDPVPVPFEDPSAHDFLTFVEGLWRATPAFQQHSSLDYTHRFC